MTFADRQTDRQLLLYINHHHHHHHVLKCPSAGQSCRLNFTNNHRDNGTLSVLPFLLFSSSLSLSSRRKKEQKEKNMQHFFTKNHCDHGTLSVLPFSSLIIIIVIHYPYHCSGTVRYCVIVILIKTIVTCSMSSSSSPPPCHC